MLVGCRQHAAPGTAPDRFDPARRLGAMAGAGADRRGGADRRAIPGLLDRQPLAIVAIVVGAAGAAWTLRQSARGRCRAGSRWRSAQTISLVGSALGLSRDPAALTSSEGSVLVVNSAYRERFGGNLPPLSLGGERGGCAGPGAGQGHGLARRRRLRRRDRHACREPVRSRSSGSARTASFCCGAFRSRRLPDPVAIAVKRVQGLAGERFAEARIMAVVVDHKRAHHRRQPPVRGSRVGPGPRGARDAFRRPGRGRRGRPDAADRRWRSRAGAPRGARSGRSDRRGRRRDVPAVRTTIRPASLAHSSNLQALLDVLPIGLALVDRDGRFLTMNQAFRQAAGLSRHRHAGLSRRSGREGGQGRGRRRGAAQRARPGHVGRPRDPARPPARPSRSR